MLYVILKNTNIFCCDCADKVLAESILSVEYSHIEAILHG